MRFATQKPAWPLLTQHSLPPAWCSAPPAAWCSDHSPGAVCSGAHATLSFVKMMSEIVAAEADLRRSEKAMPTCEKSRSTVAELAGQPRYWRAITERLGMSRRSPSSVRARLGASNQRIQVFTSSHRLWYWFTLTLQPYCYCWTKSLMLSLLLLTKPIVVCC